MLASPLVHSASRVLAQHPAFWLLFAASVCPLRHPFPAIQKWRVMHWRTSCLIGSTDAPPDTRPPVIFHTSPSQRWCLMRCRKSWLQHKCYAFNSSRRSSSRCPQDRRSSSRCPQRSSSSSRRRSRIRWTSSGQAIAASGSSTAVAAFCSVLSEVIATLAHDWQEGAATGERSRRAGQLEEQCKNCRDVQDMKKQIASTEATEVMQGAA